MIPQYKSNPPQWTEIYSQSNLPEELQSLKALTMNLWWSWQPRAIRLFQSIDPELWAQTDGNPRWMLHLLGAERIAELCQDRAFLAEVQALYDELQAYLQERPDETRPSVAYFCMEYGISNTLHIYSGGLGILAGDYVKEASDSNVRLTAVGLLYRYGYFTQSLDPSGNQVAHYVPQNFYNLPLEPVLNEHGERLTLHLEMASLPVVCQVWRVPVGRVSLYLLDTDVPENGDLAKSITHSLYGGDWENRLRQEYLLGIGGTMLLKQLGIECDVYHMNEGHAAFMNVERLVNLVEDRGLPFDVALEVVRASSLYTVHTPVPAGHDYFEDALIDRYFTPFYSRLGISRNEFIQLGKDSHGSGGKFSMSVLALHTSQEANGVSKLHGDVSKRMFAPVWEGFFPEESHVTYVTNGVHLPTWAASEWQQFFVRHFGADYLSHQSQEEMWSKIMSVPSEEIRQIRQRLKRRLIQHIQHTIIETHGQIGLPPQLAKATLDELQERALYIGFSRRFATYKRAHLLFEDLDTLAKILDNEERPVRFIFAGKAHPADGGGQALIKRIIEVSRMPQFVGKIIFLPDYDIELAKTLIPGVDVWLNNPTRLMEASGTSGEKAEMNGVLNLSVLDGWWYEGYKEGAGWALSAERTYTDQHLQDQLDAMRIYHLIEQEIVPVYYADMPAGCSDRWVDYIKRSMLYIAPHFTMRRMLDDYYERLYNKLALRSELLEHQGYQQARDIVAWKQQVAATWNTITVQEATFEGVMREPKYDGQHSDPTFRVTIDAGLIDADIVAELIVTKRDERTGEVHYVGKDLFHEVMPRLGTIRTYELMVPSAQPGKYQIAVRLRPYLPELPHLMDFAYVRWISF